MARHLLVICVLLAMVLAGCRADDVEFHNTTAATVRVFNQVAIGPGQTTTMKLAMPASMTIWKLDVWNEVNQVVFREEYTLEELVRMRWRVEIVAGHVAC